MTAPSQSTQMELCDKASKKHKRTEEDCSASMTDGLPASETRDLQPNAVKRPKRRRMAAPPQATLLAAPETGALCMRCSDSSEELTLEFSSIIGADVQMDPFKAWLLEMFGQVAKMHKVRVIERAKKYLRVLGFLNTEEMDFWHLVENLMSHVPMTSAIRHMELFNHYLKTIFPRPPLGSRRKRQLINQPDDCPSYNCHQHAPMYAFPHYQPYTAPQFQPQPLFMPTYMPPCMGPCGQLNAQPYTRLHTQPDTHPRQPQGRHPSASEGRKQQSGRFQEPNTWTQVEPPTAFGLFKQLERDNVQAEVKIKNKTLINAVLQDKFIHLSKEEQEDLNLMAKQIRVKMEPPNSNKTSDAQDQSEPPVN